MDQEKLFLMLYRAKDEEGVEQVLNEHSDLFAEDQWKPLGDNLSNYGVVKNQQASPIAALIEKVTNSIDALLMKECLLQAIDPESPEAPRSMDEAIEKFYANSNLDLQEMRRRQAEEIQVIADGKGPRTARSDQATSVIIYDNGIGQHPNDFEGTFLSLLRGNKNKIHFVQGKYNMGGSGAIVFCGKKRYQLIASKHYSGQGEFGFTLIREHPKQDSDESKETWYEYWLHEGRIPSFSINTLDLGLEGRTFKTGTLIKMYSYQFGKGYSAFSQDLNQSINEYLFEPALPVLTKDTAERYPNNKVLVTDLHGLLRRLLKEEEDYLDDKFSQTYQNDLFGIMKVSCFVFKTKVRNFDIKRTREVIRDRFFRNGMSVLFSMNGQVHGHYTSEFITRSLKLNLLKSHLLIHVDCTAMDYNFRKELFMASRDRLKDGEETRQLRWYLADKLSDKEGRLALIEKRRKQAVDIDTTSNTQQLIKNFTKNLPLNSDLMKLLGETFKLEQKKDRPNKEEKPNRPKRETEPIPFEPKRFPSKFKLEGKNEGTTTVSKIPLNGSKTLRFSTDVENDYFDRIEEPGDLKISVLNIGNNEQTGGTAPGKPKEPTELFNIVRSSPHEGSIRLTLNPKEEMSVGDTVTLKTSLTAPGQDFDEIFMVMVVDPQKPKRPTPKPEVDDEPLGLPALVFSYRDKEGKGDGCVSWDDVGEATSEQMDFSTVMIPEAEGDNLKAVYVNMESTVLMNFRSKYKHPNQDQIELTNRKYYTSVYFHVLFLYTITKNRGYQIQQRRKDAEEHDIIDLGTYLKDLFDNYYSTFILNFGGMEEMMQGIGD